MSKNYLKKLHYRFIILLNTFSALIKYNSILKVLIFFLKKKRKSPIIINYKNYKLKIRANPTDIHTLKQNLNDEFTILKKYFNKYDKLKILDAGGFIGFSALKFNEMFPTAKIYVFEPSSDNFKILKFNVKKKKNIKIFNVALSNFQGYSNLFDYNYGPASYTLGFKDGNIKTKSSVKVFDINRILKKFKLIDILKLDVEGEEYKILNNKFNFKRVKFIFLEIHKNKNKLKLLKFLKTKKKNILKVPKSEKYLLY